MKIGFMGGKFLPFHLGHLYAVLEAHNLVDKLYVVLSSSTNRDKELCARDGVKYMPAEVRMSWIGEALNDLDNVEIINIIDDQWNEDYDWANGAKLITEAIPEKITHVFSSEVEYTELFKKYYPFAEHVIVDRGRETVTCTATQLRKELYSNWEKLPVFVRGFFTKRIAIVGTESVGKSTLTTKLSKFYNTNYVPEVGRTYCEKYKNNLTVNMFDSIAMKHFVYQDELAPLSNTFLFVDSDAVVTKYYLDMYYGEKSDLIDSIIKIQNFDLCLYLEPDVPWVADGFRFSGKDAERTDNNQKLKLMYSLNGMNYESVSGTYSERFLKARILIDNIINGETNV